MSIGTVWASGSWVSTSWVDGCWRDSEERRRMTPFAKIASRIVGRLVTSLDIDPAWIKPVANDQYTVTVAEDFFIYVQFFGLTRPRDPALDFVNSGAGRLSRPVARRVRIYIYTRTGEDAYGEDTIALFGGDPSQTYVDDYHFPGQFLGEELVLNSLDDWTVVDEDDNPISLGPLHVMDASEEPQRRREDDAGLIRSCLDFEVVYVLSQDPTEPINDAE